MTEKEYKLKIFQMMNYAAKAKAIGDEIVDKLEPYGDDELFDLLNAIQDCEVTDIKTALEVFEHIKESEQ